MISKRNKWVCPETHGRVSYPNGPMFHTSAKVYVSYYVSYHAFHTYETLPDRPARPRARPPGARQAAALRTKET